MKKVTTINGVSSRLKEAVEAMGPAAVGKEGPACLIDITADMEHLADHPQLTRVRLLALMKATSDVIYRMSPDWKTMTELYGKGFLADTESADENWLDKYIHPEDQKFVTGVIDECIRGKRIFELEHRVLREDGSIGWTCSRAVPLLDGRGAIKEWFGAASDITAQKKMEEALHVSEAKYRSLFEIATDGFWWTNSEGFIIEASEGLAKMLGRQVSELVGRSWMDFIDEQLFGAGHRACAELRSGHKNIYELKMKRKDGSLIWARMNEMPLWGEGGKFAGGLGFFANITNRKQAEAAQRESERKYRELVRYAPAGICEFDFEGYRFVSVNDVMCKLTGYSREELLNMDPFGLLAPEGRALCKKRIALRCSGKEPGPPLDYRVLTKEGREVHFSLDASLLRDESGAPAGLTLIAHDVTVRKKMEEALRRSEEELRKADRNKNNFLSMLSHELRNPLAAITAGISLLEISEDKSQMEKVKGIIKRQNKQLCKLVDDLLDLTRITRNVIELKKENINLRDLVINTAKDHASFFEDKGIHFSMEVTDKPLQLDADPVRIKQSIGNLLHNALKFTPEGGTVRLLLKRERDEAVITVKDNGAGISPELLPELFKPFTQADVSLDRHDNGGLGLGLSIVQQITEMHGGTVTAESGGPGQGSLFVLRLPVYM